MNGQPCIRNLRITVRRLMELLAIYSDHTEIYQEFPELEEEDIGIVGEVAMSESEDIEIITRADQDNHYSYYTRGVAHIHNGVQIFKFKILTQQSFQDKFYVYLPSIIMNMCNA